MAQVIERVKERIAKGEAALIDGKEMIDLAKRAGIDVTEQETKLFQLEEELVKMKKAVMETKSKK